MSWIANVIRRTAAREGSYASLNPNSDGAGLSFGILQWTQASGNLGNTLKVMGKFEEAVICCRRHLEICQEHGDRIGIGRALYNLGNVYHAKVWPMFNFQIYCCSKIINAGRNILTSSSIKQHL